MKYIRTKDVIYESADHYTSKEWIELNCGLLVKSKNKDIFLKDCEITKTADTIRELCDCYAYGTETTRDYDVARGWNINDRKVYGCILTEKGIINVAKFNSKGDLELV